MNATRAATSATTRMAIHAIRTRIVGSTTTTTSVAAARRFATTTVPKRFFPFPSTIPTTKTKLSPLVSSFSSSISPWWHSDLQQQQQQPLASTRTATTSSSTHRFFATDSGSGGGNDTTDADADADAETIKPVVVDLDSHSNADLDEYDPFAIVQSFEDTSYYYPPSDETDPQFLAEKYKSMTNEELLDSTTIASPNTKQQQQQQTWDSLMHSPPIRDKNASLPKGTLVGTVVSTKMQKTVNVAVDRYKVHKKYRKRTKYTRKFMAHDEHEVARDGDLVLIVPSQRISKNKHFVLKEILKAKGQL